MEMQKCRPYRINIKPSQKTSWLDFWHTLNFSIYVVFFYTPQYNIASWLMAATPQLSCRGLSKKKMEGRTVSAKAGLLTLLILTGLLCQGFENNKRQKILLMFRFCCPLQHHWWLSTGPRTSVWTQPPNPQFCCSQTKTQIFYKPVEKTTCRSSTVIPPRMCVCVCVYCSKTHVNQNSSPVSRRVVQLGLAWTVRHHWQRCQHFEGHPNTTAGSDCGVGFTACHRPVGTDESSWSLLHWSILEFRYNYNNNII